MVLDQLAQVSVSDSGDDYYELAEVSASDYIDDAESAIRRQLA